MGIMVAVRRTTIPLIAILLVPVAVAVGTSAQDPLPPTGRTAIAAPTCIARGVAPAILPDRNCTPGAVDPGVTQANILTTICVSGYTDRVRTDTRKLKLQQMAAYGYTDSPSAHEEDHLVPLQLGGAPSDPANLWPEPDDTPNPKDVVESRLKRAVCAGTVTLAAAQTAIALDWTRAFELIASWCPTP